MVGHKVFPGNGDNDNINDQQDRICRARVLFGAQNTLWVKEIEILEKLQNNKMFTVINKLKREILSSSQGVENTQAHHRVLRDLCLKGNVTFDDKDLEEAGGGNKRRCRKKDEKIHAC